MSSSLKEEDKMLEKEQDSLMEQEEFSLPRFSQPTGYIDYETTAYVSMETHLSETNIGYKLLQKMGWTAGEGLGPTGQGRIDPIRIELKDDSLGVGKSQELNETHISSTSKRKALDSEKQLEESEIQRIEREYQAEKKQAVAKELEEVRRAFYCELCDKQYKKIIEYEQHLQSYDHHHKKRFKDMKESMRNSSLNQSEREKKLAREKKREERELKRMQEALQKKIGGVDQQPKKPALIPTAAVSSSANIGGGGWSTVSDSGGWTLGAPSVPASVQKGLSANTSGGWTSSAPNVPVVATKINSPISTNNAPSISVKTQPETSTASNTPTAPKKLAFGLKKSGFQFELKKK